MSSETNIRATDIVLERAGARTAGRAAAPIWERKLLGRIWHFFTSVRLALILILAIAAAVLIGTLLDQAPPSVLADSALRGQWLERAHAKYGLWTDVFNFLDFFNIFHSLWFRGLIGLLTVNIIVCSINRWKGIWSTVFPARIKMTDSFFQHARFNAAITTPLPPSMAVQRLRRALSRSGYRVSLQTDEGSTAIYADKNRFSRFGTLVSHLAIVLLLAGTVVGGIWGFSDSEFIVPEGATRDLGLGTGLSVKLEHFTDEYYLEGPPKDFSSEIVIMEGGKEVKRGVTRVNSPVSYDGIQFHQSFFGQTAVMNVKGSDGQTIFDSAVPLAWQTTDANRPVGSFDLPAQNLTVYVIGPKSGETDPLIPAGETRVELYQRDSGNLVTSNTLSQSTASQVDGMDFTFVREGRFTGLKVVKDPGVNLIWIAGALMVAGLAMLFYFPHRRLWASCKPTTDGQSEIKLGMAAQRDMQLTAEFKRVRERVTHALRKKETARTPTEGGRHV